MPNPPSIADQDRVARAQQGDQRALGELCEKNYDRVARFVRQRVGNAADVDELVQDTFVEMQRSIAAYQGRSSFSTWLLSISLNLIRNHYNRSPSHRYQFVEEREWSVSAVEERTPMQELLDGQQMEMLVHAIDRLPDSLKLPFVKVVVEGLAYEEAAESLRLSVSSLKSRLFRARKLLKQALVD